MPVAVWKEVVLVAALLAAAAAAAARGALVLAVARHEVAHQDGVERVAAVSLLKCREMVLNKPYFFERNAVPNSQFSVPHKFSPSEFKFI